MMGIKKVFWIDESETIDESSIVHRTPWTRTTFS